MLKNKIIRIAKPCTNITDTIKFYHDILGMDILYRFEQHAGFDGVMFGFPDAPYHLEFTKDNNHPLEPLSTADDLIVFYLPDQKEWQELIGRLAEAGCQPIPSLNPYWDKNGKTFQDPDGYRVVLQHAAWTI